MNKKVIIIQTTSSCQDFTYEIGVKGQLRIQFQFKLNVVTYIT